MNSKIKLIIDIVQWVLIIFLVGFAFYYASRYKADSAKFIQKEKESTYKLIYYSQNLNSLKKENRDLYNALDSIKNVESAIEYKYVYSFQTDTITIDNIVVNEADSIYSYTFDNDTIMFNMNAKAANIEWMQGGFSVRDRFRIITKNDDGRIETTIQTTTPGSVIESPTVWRKKDSWLKNVYIGPTVGVGYGLTSNKFDAWVGVSVGYKF